MRAAAGSLREDALHHPLEIIVAGGERHAVDDLLRHAVQPDRIKLARPGPSRAQTLPPDATSTRRQMNAIHAYRLNENAAVKTKPRVRMNASPLFGDLAARKRRVSAWFGLPSLSVSSGITMTADIWHGNEPDLRSAPRFYAGLRVKPRPREMAPAEGFGLQSFWSTTTETQIYSGIKQNSAATQAYSPRIVCWQFCWQSSPAPNRAGSLTHSPRKARGSCASLRKRCAEYTTYAWTMVLTEMQENVMKRNSPVIIGHQKRR